MQAGDLVEDFTLQNQDGEDVSLSQFKDKPVVLFFYPRADTPGCTIEACGFRDTFEKLQGAGAVVLGISRDTVKAQKKFKDKYDLPYMLLADPDMVLIQSLRPAEVQEHVREASEGCGAQRPSSSARTRAKASGCCISTPR